MLKIAIICLLFSSHIQISVSDDSSATEESINVTSNNFYTAAVLEFNSPGNSFTNAQQIVEVNLKEYIKWIYEAKEHNVDILAFPEATLNYNGLSKDDLKKFAILLPQEVVDREYEYSCDYSSNAILNELSDATGNASIYVLLNIIERGECNASDAKIDNCLYNTNIVLNRYGCIVSKYRKFNLFKEPYMTVPEEPELATFETDFGVTFGHFICFDIFFKFPTYDLVLSNISHIIYPSNWFSVMPFLTSIQLQQNFAYRNNIVILSSGANSPSNANTGSGIFIGKHGATDSIISGRNETKIIISKVPKDINDDTFIPDKSTIKPYTAVEMDKLDTWTFNPQNVFPLKEHFHFDDGNIDCEFTINFTKSSVDTDVNIGYTYKLAVFNGIRNFENILNGGEIYCAIVSCVTDDIHTCGQRFKNSDKLVPSVDFHSIKIVTKMRNEGVCLIMPTSLDFSLRPLNVDKFEFAETSNEHSHQVFEIETMSQLNEIMTFGIYGRNYTADNKDFHEIVTDSSLTTEFDPQLSTEESTDDVTEQILDVVEEGSSQLFGWILYGALMVVLCIIAAFLVYRRLQDPYQHPLVIMRRKSEMNPF